MKNYCLYILFILSFQISCVKEDNIDFNKFEDLNISQKNILPFVHVNLNSEIYQNLKDSIESDEYKIISDIDFLDGRVVDEIESIEFIFKSFNAFPMKIVDFSFSFLSKDDEVLFNHSLGEIDAAILDENGNLKEVKIYEHKPVIFLHDQIAELIISRYLILTIKVDKSNLPETKPEFYFKNNSVTIVKTIISSKKTSK